MRFEEPVEAIFFDLEGTLYISGEWIPGAAETVNRLKEQYAVRFVTNTTMRSRRQVSSGFDGSGLEVPLDWIFTPARAASQWFENHQAEGILSLVNSNLLEDLRDLPLTDNLQSADYVLVGDMGEEWTIDHLNRGLNALINGARLVTMARNRQWKDGDTYKLDTGAFVAALEYGANTTCEAVFGKPNALFYEMALQTVGTKASNVIMVGDDVETDVLGAEACGLNGVLVQTGKFRPEQIAGRADRITMIEDVSKLPDLL